MGVTRGKVVSPAFTQPALGGTIVLRLDPSVDWLRDSALVKIDGVGIYKILSHSGFSFTLQCKRAIIVDGSAAPKSIIHPVAGSFEELVDSPVSGFSGQETKIIYVGENGERLEYGEEGEIGDFPDYSQKFKNLLNF